MEEVVCDMHWISGSVVISFLCVRVIWVAVVVRNVATRGSSCAGDG